MADSGWARERVADDRQHVDCGHDFEAGSRVDAGCRPAGIQLVVAAFEDMVVGGASLWD